MLKKSKKKIGASSSQDDRIKSYLKGGKTNKERNVGADGKVLSEDISLGFMKTLRKGGAGYWNYERSLEAVKLFQECEGDYEKVAKEMKCKPSRIKNHMAEIRKASKEFGTLLEYWKAGRPFKQGAPQTVGEVGR